MYLFVDKMCWRNVLFPGAEAVLHLDIPPISLSYSMCDPWQRYNRYSAFAAVRMKRKRLLPSFHMGKLVPHWLLKRLKKTPFSTLGSPVSKWYTFLRPTETNRESTGSTVTSPKITLPSVACRPFPPFGRMFAGSMICPSFEMPRSFLWGLKLSQRASGARFAG